jgi:hypothetical protein
MLNEGSGIRIGLSSTQNCPLIIFEELSHEIEIPCNVNGSYGLLGIDEKN